MTVSGTDNLTRIPVGSLPALGARRSRATAGVRSDLGTLLLHWTVAVAIGASLATGLRIAADAPGSVIAKALSRVLPQGEVWTVHFISSVVLFFASTAYALYLRRSGLKRRVSWRKLLVFTLPTAMRLRVGAVNVLLYWAFYALVVTLTLTGIALYLGYGGWLVSVHSACAFASLAYVAAHIVTHALYGGWAQILRIFQPTRLVPNRATKGKPLVTAIVAGVLVASGLAWADLATRDRLVITKVEQAPALDGVLTDAAWKTARPTFVYTMQGANLGGRGESTVEVRAVHDGAKVYFAFRWEDPSQSLRRLPLIKKEDGWHLVGTNAGSADVTDFYEDKFAVILSLHDGFGAAGATHLGPRPVADKPSSLNERGLHYTDAADVIDMWQWKSSRGGMNGFIDDQYIGRPKNPTTDEIAKRARYQGGYWSDPGKSVYAYNFPFQGPGGYQGPIEPKRLPKNVQAMTAALGRPGLDDPDSSVEDGSQWWLWEQESVPYSKEGDEAIPLGTVMPGVVLSGHYEGDRDDLRCGAKWQDGYWTLEVARNLTTGSAYDVDFVAGRKLFMWVTDIYAGRIDNWREVGGADLKIKVVRREDTDSTLGVLRASLPGWKDLALTTRSKLSTTTQDAVETVKQTAGAVGFGPYSRSLENGTTVLSIDGRHPRDDGYPSAVTVALLYKEGRLGEGPKELMAFLKTTKAQNAMMQLGGIPVSP